MFRPGRYAIACSASSGRSFYLALNFFSGMVRPVSVYVFIRQSSFFSPGCSAQRRLPLPGGVPPTFYKTVSTFYYPLKSEAATRRLGDPLSVGKGKILFSLFGRRLARFSVIDIADDKQSDNRDHIGETIDQVYRHLKRLHHVGKNVGKGKKDCR